MHRLAWFSFMLLAFPTSAVAQTLPRADVASFEPDRTFVPPVRTSYGAPPEAFALGPSRWLLAGDGELWVLDGARATPLPPGSLQGAPGFGLVVRTLDESGGGRGRVRLWGVHPSHPRLVLLFTGELGARPQVIGQTRGDLVVADAIGDQHTIWRLRPGATLRVTRIRGQFRLEGPDAVRGSWAVALPIGRTLWGPANAHGQPGERALLRLVDVESGQVRSIGMIDGCWEPTYTGSHGRRLVFRAAWDDATLEGRRDCTATVAVPR